MAAGKLGALAALANEIRLCRARRFFQQALARAAGRVSRRSGLIPFLVREDNNMSASTIVIPANAGIQFLAKNIKFPIFAECFLDPGVRRDDEVANLVK